MESRRAELLIAFPVSGVATETVIIKLNYYYQSNRRGEEKPLEKEKE